MHRIEIEVDDSKYAELVAEAERLGVDTQEVVRRALAAWLVDMEEASTAWVATPPEVPSQ